MDTSSFTAFDSETLEALGVDDISDYTPNLELVTAETRSLTLFIRGVGLNDFSPIATATIHGGTGKAKLELLGESI